MAQWSAWTAHCVAVPDIMHVYAETLTKINCDAIEKSQVQVTKAKAACDSLALHESRLPPGCTFQSIHPPLTQALAT